MHPAPALFRIIHRTIREARESGLDRLGQTRRATLAVMQAHPDITATDAMTLVKWVERGGREGGASARR